MKKFQILIIYLITTIMLTISGCNNPNSLFAPWDKLGGGKQGTDVTDYSNETTSEYLIDAITNNTSISDGSYDATASNYYEINLDEIVSKDLSSITAYSYSNNELKIKENGIFVLSGSMSGCVTVNDTSDTIQLVLNGVSINTTTEQDCAAIVFKKPDNDTISERILTIKEGTINLLSDSIGDNADGDRAVIQAKKRDLTINGTGTLKLNCLGEETSGLKIKKALTINGTTIEVNGANKSGIKADEQIIVKNANITITSNGDGIKTDIEPETDEEAKIYASESKYGYLYIENTDFDITASDDGISANNCLYIKNTTSNVIKITTNGGAPTIVTETSSDNADGKAIKTDGIEFNDITYIPTYSSNYGLIITGGKFIINSNDDAITSKGNLLISGGDFEISTGDDGIHAEYLTKISGGNIVVNKCYEAVEGATVEILDGTLDLTSVDDGINAANSDLGNYSFYILISGGNVTINASGDGIDSNGTVKITGGSVYVYGPTNSANAALDADTGVIITGGNIVAVGSAGMIENPSSNSTQCYVSLTLSSSVTANTKIIVENSNGEIVFDACPIKSYQSVIVSLNSFVKNETFTITVGNETYTATLSSIGTALGMNMHGSGNQGFRPGGRK